MSQYELCSVSYKDSVGCWAGGDGEEMSRKAVLSKFSLVTHIPEADMRGDREMVMGTGYVHGQDNVEQTCWEITEYWSGQNRQHYSENLPHKAE